MTHKKPLKQGRIDIISKQECHQHHDDRYGYFINEYDHICGSGYADTCPGDSGGPLICTENEKSTIYGVTSFSFERCGMPKYHGIYTNVYTHVPWIIGVIDEQNPFAFAFNF